MSKIKSEGTDALSQEIDELVAKDQEQDQRLDAIEARLDALEGDGGDGPTPPDPEPPSGDYPDESNTGAKGTLTDHNGDYSLSNGQTLQDKRIRGTLRVSGKGCKVLNVEVVPTGPWGIDAEWGDGTLFEDVTVVGPARNDSAIFLGDNATARRVKTSGYENGIIFGGGRGLLEDSLVWKLRAGAEGHYDAVVPRGGGSGHPEQNGVTIRHNTLYSWDTSNIFMKPDFGSISNVVIEDNQLLNDTNGSKPSYPIYSVTNPSMPPITGVVIRNNKIQKGAYGYASFEDNDPVWEGNVDYDTGQTIPKPQVQKADARAQQAKHPPRQKM